VAGIFINYRSGDDAFAAALVDRVLTAEFGAENVFRDSRALSPGVDFPPELWRRLIGSTVFLALIGRHWLTIRNGTGRRRLEVPEDYVRREIGEALRRNLAVIPILLDGARLPSAGELPAEITGLATRQYLELRVRNSDADLRWLVDALGRLVPRQVDELRQRPTVDNRGATFGGSQFIGSTIGSVNHYGLPPENHRDLGLALLRQRCYPEAAAHFRKSLAEPTAGADEHYYLALALLDGQPPRDHASLTEVTGHLEQALSLIPARLLRLIVDEDQSGRRRRTAPDPIVLMLVGQLEPAQADEIVSQFRSVNSQTWQALLRRAQGR